MFNTIGLIILYSEIKVTQRVTPTQTALAHQNPKHAIIFQNRKIPHFMPVECELFSEAKHIGS